MPVMFTYRAMMREAYKLYTASQDWQAVKQRVIARDNGACVDCGDTGVIVHHEHYRDWGKGNAEEVQACVLVCRQCHTKRHKTMETPFFAWREDSEIIYGASDKELSQVTEAILSL